ncbi:hypothetical protein [Mastigocladopsis repens]|uniref:hypothetical protein n=1 Tax=Mastigocladopsis repens TaxID=221287 RepID=UPI0002F2BEAD|nr:hypothetical protein [Mastigocladopsis repens]
MHYHYAIAYGGRSARKSCGLATPPVGHWRRTRLPLTASHQQCSPYYSSPKSFVVSHK